MQRKAASKIVRGLLGDSRASLAQWRFAPLAGSKFALFGYLASVATEVCDRGVGVTLCCPGPIATGSGDTPRNIFGAQGRIVQNNTGSSNRIAPERCARLIAAAMAHGLDECWIARHPVLVVGGWLPAWGVQATLPAACY